METIKVVTGNTADEIWQKIANDFAGTDMLEYQALLQQTNCPQILLEIDIDMGGGFEGGYEMTRFSAPVNIDDNFRFALHHESFLDKAGKLLGLEDKILGYPEFDKAVIVKTNDENKVKQVFADASVRTFFQTLEDFNLHINRTDEDARLELEIENGITDVTTLRKVYDAFSKVVTALSNDIVATTYH